MARVLAKMCGYEPLEINASDERTGNQILNRVKTAISRDNHFINKDSNLKAKPVCLIVDEVDGALGSTFDGDSSKGVASIVDYLKKCITAMNTTNTKSKVETLDSEDDDEIMEEDPKNEEEKIVKPKKKDTDVVPLRRPIIFICNDIYAKALLPLKDLALNVKINQANP